MSAAAKVGAFFVMILILAGLLVWRIEELRLGRGKAQRISIEFKDVAVLDAKSTVRVAGVRVGKVAKIRIDRATGKAIVDVDIDPDVDLRQGASAAIANLGLLGKVRRAHARSSSERPPFRRAPSCRETRRSASTRSPGRRDIEQDVKGISSNLNQSPGGPQGKSGCARSSRTSVSSRKTCASCWRPTGAMSTRPWRTSGVLRRAQLVDRLDTLVASNQANVIRASPTSGRSRRSSKPPRTI